MLRTIPVDSERVGMLATGHVESVRVWADRDGRRVMTDEQERDEATGLPTWTVWVLALSGDRPDTVAVRVPAKECPQPAPMEPVVFAGLSVNVRIDRSGRLAGYWSALALGPAAVLAGERS